MAVQASVKFFLVALGFSIPGIFLGEFIYYTWPWVLITVPFCLLLVVREYLPTLEEWEARPFRNGTTRVDWFYKNRALRALPSKRHIRLLQIEPDPDATTIHCSLHVCHVDMLPHVEYYALSYKWEQPDLARDYQPLIIDREPVHVQSTLTSFLRLMRHERFSKRIFIDAICINQQAEWERDEQVKLMGTIYRNATTVFVWLGEVKTTAFEFWVQSEELSRFLAEQSMLLRQNDRSTVTIHWPDKAKQLVKHVLSRPYWTRLWIVQEILLAQDILVYCGEQGSSNRVKFNWDQMASLQSTSTHQNNERLFNEERFVSGNETLSREGDSTWGPAGRIFRAKTRWDSPKRLGSDTVAREPQSRESSVLDEFERKPNHGFPIHQALRQFRSQQCTEPRDKLYGLLGLIEDAGEIDPDYTAPLLKVCNLAVEKSLYRMHEDLKHRVDSGVDRRNEEYDALYSDVISLFPLSKAERDQAVVEAEKIALPLIKSLKASSRTVE